VQEAGTLIPKRHQSMLLGILDLERITVEDIMVPRNAIEGIDIDEDWDEISNQLTTSHHTRLPVYHGNLDNIIGIIHLRRAMHALRDDDLDKDSLHEYIRPAYFVPEGTPVTTQLLNMQKEKRRMGLVVDEYGDLMGIVTLDEILEEIVGDFTTQAPGEGREFHPKSDDSYMINGSASIRDLNRKMGWHLPVDGPKTINGLILEKLEDIPVSGTTILVDRYPIEVVQTMGASVRMARIYPRVSEYSSDTDSAA
jgi:Mg2+/Co2+ transporter CorB